MTEPGTALPPEMLAAADRYAVYRCYSDDGTLLYIGSTGRLGRRLSSHAEKVWFQQVRGITLEWHADELAALNAERRAIHIEHPRYNVVHRNGSAPQPRQRNRGGSRSKARTKAERLIAKNPHMTINEIAAKADLSPRTVSRIRAEKRTPSLAPGRR